MEPDGQGDEAAVAPLADDRADHEDGPEQVAGRHEGGPRRTASDSHAPDRYAAAGTRTSEIAAWARLLTRSRRVPGALRRPPGRRQGRPRPRRAPGPGRPPEGRAPRRRRPAVDGKRWDERRAPPGAQPCLGRGGRGYPASAAAPGARCQADGAVAAIPSRRGTASIAQAPCWRGNQSRRGPGAARARQRCHFIVLQ